MLRTELPVAEEVEAQYELSRRIVPMDPLQARAAGERALALAEAAGMRQRHAQSLCAIGISYLGTADYETALGYFERSVEKCAELEYDFGRLDALIYHGTALAAMSRYEEALESYKKARRICSEHNEEPGLRYISNNIAVIHLQRGEYIKALDIYEQLLDQERGDPAALASTLNNIGSLYIELDDYEKALEVDREAVQIRRRLGLEAELAMTLSNISSVCMRLGRNDEAREINDEAIAIAERLHLEDVRIMTLRNRGRLLALQGNRPEALKHFDEALEILRNAGGLRLRGDILYHKGRTLLAGKDYEEALPCLLEAIGETRESQERRLEMESEGALAEAYEALGDVPQALEHYKRHLQITRELLGEDRQKALAAMEIRYRTERAEKDREIYRLKSEKLELENLNKTRELTVLTMSLVQKKEELRNLRAHVEQMARELQGAMSEVTGDLLASIDVSLRSEQEWALFEQQFGALHPDFIRILLEHHPGLTPTELKVCSLLRINLSTKEIASLLSVSSRAVEGHRYNLRKKLGFQGKTSLATYLAGL